MCAKTQIADQAVSFPVKVRKKPVEVEAMRWDGGNLATIRRFTGQHTVRLRPDPKQEAPGLEVFALAEKSWVFCPTGHYIIKGVEGEFYPCAPNIFAKTYEEVTP